MSPALMPMIQSRVTVDDDGALRWQGRRWLEVEPGVYRHADGPDYIVFRDAGRIDRRLSGRHVRPGSGEHCRGHEHRATWSQPTLRTFQHVPPVQVSTAGR